MKSGTEVVVRLGETIVSATYLGPDKTAENWRMVGLKEHPANWNRDVSPILSVRKDWVWLPEDYARELLVQ